ncbi:hypothetical protein BD770DRAFT_411205 [Pilaira anomala]|nr:hypothetical protein BD770DRAFT_411205 [Pilaira anomala]
MKLPNQDRHSHVGKMELIANFLDYKYSLSPLCHCPDKNKIDGMKKYISTSTTRYVIMIAAPQKKTSDMMLGYIEEILDDSMLNHEFQKIQQKSEWQILRFVFNKREFN